MAKSVFKNAIDYRRVRVHHGGYLPFGLQHKDTAMTPNGEMYYPTLLYNDDFAKAEAAQQWLFIHEMAHVWQHQMGMSVRTRGLISWLVEYKYSLPPYYTLADYPMEQQASIIADYFILTEFGMERWLKENFFKGIVGPDLLNKYENTLKYFIEDPKDRRTLCK
nr:hypothetical protein [Winslowiella iniecta]